MKRGKQASRGLRILLRLTGWTIGLAGILLIGALIFLFLFGLPIEWTDHVREVLRDAGIPVQFERIYLSRSGRGWILDEVRVYSGSPDQLAPILSADEVAVHLVPVDWRDLRGGGWRIHMTVPDLRVDPPGITPQQIGADHPVRRIEQLESSVKITPRKISLNRFQAEWGWVQLDLAGSVERRERPDDLPAFELDPVVDWAEWLLERLTIEGDASVHIRFHLDPSSRDLPEVAVKAAFSELAWKGRSFGPVKGRLHGDSAGYTLEKLQLEHPDGSTLSMNGSMEVESGEIKLGARSTLPAEAILDWLPEPIPELMEEHQIRFSGSPKLKVNLGPAPLDRLHERVDAVAGGVDLEIGSFRFAPVDLEAALRGVKVDVHRIQAEVEGDPLAGAFRIDLETLAWECDVDARCNPQFAGLFNEELAEFISRFSFPREPPETKLALSQTARGEPLRIDGTLAGEQFEWGGVPIYKANTTLNYQERTLTLDPLHIVRDDERNAYLEGFLEIAFPPKTARFDAQGVFSPVELARIIHPEYPTVLNHLSFNGPVRLRGRGTVDYGDRTGQDFAIEASGSQIGWNAIESGAFQLDLHGSGKHLVLTNATASIWNGTAEGHGRFLWTGNEDHSPYHIRVDLKNSDFARVAALGTDQEVRRVRGKLNGHLDLNADAAEEAFWTSAQGKGRVRIREGHLADLPLLGGFTRLIQTTIPGFRAFSLTTLSADFEIRDAAVHSPSVELGGTLISATGRGSWSPTEGLDFLVRAEPFRQTSDDRSWYQVHLWAVDALKTGTSPFFRMLELRLEGTLQDPVWRIAALPDEVRDIFRR